MTIKRAFFVLVVMLLASASVQAQLTITTYTDRDLFNAAVSDQHIETFEAQSTGRFNSRNFPGFNVNVTRPRSNWAAIREAGNGNRFLRYHSNFVGRPGSMQILFDQATAALGFDWRNSDPSGDHTIMVLEVPGGQSFEFGDGESGFFGVVIHDGDAVGSMRFYDKPRQGEGHLHFFNMDNIAFATTDAALFKVTKDFTPNSTATVDVKLTCDTGHDREQEATIAGEDSEGVVFVLTDIPLQGADCTVTEGTASGYATSYSPSPCSWTDVQGGDQMYTCVISNQAKPVTYGFTKVWITGGDGGNGGEDIVRESNVGIQCTAVITGSTSGAYYSDKYNRKWTSKSTDGVTDYWVYVTATGATPACWSFEDAQDSAIEVTKSGACGRTTINIGGSVRTCTITNTVFFEGIPTLSQYGLAIMALLMLGVGFVGFRRFV